MAMITFLAQAIPLAFIGAIALAYVIGIPSYAVVIGIKRLARVRYAIVPVLIIGVPAFVAIVTWLAGQ